jgi:hypothetical protein
MELKEISMFRFCSTAIAVLAAGYALHCAAAQEQTLSTTDSSHAAMQMVVPPDAAAGPPTFAARPETNTSALTAPSGMQVQSGFSVVQSAKDRREASFFDLPETGYRGRSHEAMELPKKE